MRNRRIRPGHHSLHASPDRIPPQTERAVRVYLFIPESMEFKLIAF